MYLLAAMFWIILKFDVKCKILFWWKHKESIRSIFREYNCVIHLFVFDFTLQTFLNFDQNTFNTKPSLINKHLWIRTRMILLKCFSFYSLLHKWDHRGFSNILPLKILNLNNVCFWDRQRREQQYWRNTLVNLKFFC